MTIPEYSAEELRARGSLKWTTYPDTLGAFIAEADFGTAPAVHRALAELQQAELFTYAPPAMTRDMAAATAEFCARRFGWEVPPAQVAAVPDVITAFAATIDIFTEPGAPVVLPTPAYMPFFRVAPLHGREVREVPMLRTDSGWEIDFDAVDAAMTPGALLVVCNPHNPIGKVYTGQELEHISELVERHSGRVFADEIHAPLVYEAGSHIPYASVSEAAARHAITSTSASKAFNIPGLKCAQIIFSNAADLARYREFGEFVSHSTAVPGIVANTAAYRDGDAWLAEQIAYLDDNRRLLGDLLAQHLPEAKWVMPQGTYISWIDLRDCQLPQGPAEFFREQAGVVLTDGRECGQVGAGHVRLNFATPRPILAEIVERMGTALGG
ncbi:aminotransferase class I/II-fold pyridoxal phosphate-dependent enzyme [Brevibacterium daeguense]|uniref:cysteine-S-conjugate beta-lyase n=1 Tax=Brevibacterium daeguense TaxID=909936 RepID=A0ABP8ELP8_9MICO|nr:aminotransferase class I/II-fold pyridoxal phosphate-dependent enzyme [Brevibacterium daeguense]